MSAKIKVVSETVSHISCCFVSIFCPLKNVFPISLVTAVKKLYWGRQKHRTHPVVGFFMESFDFSVYNVVKGYGSVLLLKFRGFFQGKNWRNMQIYLKGDTLSNLAVLGGYFRPIHLKVNAVSFKIHYCFQFVETWKAVQNHVKSTYKKILGWRFRQTNLAVETSLRFSTPPVYKL